MDIFRAVQEEYEFEGIELADVSYEDNSDVLNLVESRMGLIAVLNEECVRPRGNDQAFCTKVYAMNKENKTLIKDKFYRDYEFGIKHYAGPVVYDANMFVKKNQDTLPSDLLECVKKSSNRLVCEEFSKGEDSGNVASSKANLSRRGSRSSSKRTLWTKFKSQLVSLMDNISSTKTRYIRCIKPNQQKKPKLMEPISTIEQLRCAGVVAAVTISRAAFPNRLPHHVVLEKFSSLSKDETMNYHKDTEKEDQDYANDVNRLLSLLLLPLEEADKKAFVCGKSKVYFRAGALEFLEQERINAMAHRVVVLQRYVRGYYARSKYQSLREVTIKVQAKARSAMFRRRYITLRLVAINVQRIVRAFLARKIVLQLRREKKATMIQNRFVYICFKIKLIHMH